MASLLEINEDRPEIAAAVASEIRAIAAWLDAHAEDLAADTGRMLVSKCLHLDVDIDIKGLSRVSTSREYIVPRKRVELKESPRIRKDG